MVNTLLEKAIQISFHLADLHSNSETRLKLQSITNEFKCFNLCRYSKSNEALKMFGNGAGQ